MDERWSRFIQHADMLDTSRTARFTPNLVAGVAAFADGFPGERFLELGCGTGAMLRAFARQYPHKAFQGLDRDTAFIDYAAARATAECLANLTFTLGDAYALPYADGSFDGTMSFTVLEHVDPARFFAEQLRVLRPGGFSLTMSMFPAASLLSAPEHVPPSAEEKALRAITRRVFDRCRQYDGLVARHALAAHEIPPVVQRAGFAQVRMAFFAVSLSLQPNDPNSAANLLAEETDELSGLATLEALEADWTVQHPGYIREWTPALRERLARYIRERYAQRRALLEETWAVNARMMMAVCGIKPR